MAEKLKVELQDADGNIYYLHTDASVVFCEDGTSVQTKLDAKIDTSKIVQNAVTAATDKVVSAAVAKDLQDQITLQNTNMTKIDDVPFLSSNANVTVNGGAIKRWGCLIAFAIQINVNAVIAEKTELIYFPIKSIGVFECVIINTYYPQIANNKNCTISGNNIICSDSLPGGIYTLRGMALV